jgi:hypothetical protein
MVHSSSCFDLEALILMILIDLDGVMFLSFLVGGMPFSLVRGLGGYGYFCASRLQLAKSWPAEQSADGRS